MSSVIIGIDPGLKGAIAFNRSNGSVVVLDLPTVKRNGKDELDFAALAHMIRDRVDLKRESVEAFIEQVGAMPGNGASSMFRFGETAGGIRGVLACLGIPLTRILPARWKKALAVPAEKNEARRRASELMPAAASLWPLVKHDGRAEAALIAFYGRRHAATADLDALLS